jgi:hypothetical protein
MAESLTAESRLHESRKGIRAATPFWYCPKKVQPKNLVGNSCFRVALVVFSGGRAQIFIERGALVEIFALPCLAMPRGQRIVSRPTAD